MFVDKFKLILLFLALSISGCLPVVAPTVNFEKSSEDGGKIRNVEVNWNGYHLLGSDEFSDCGGGAQIFDIKRDSDFFGPVHVEWENDKGKKLSKEFIFKRGDLPSMSKRHRKDVYAYVNIYFGQNDIEYATSDSPNLKEMDKKYPCNRDKIRKRELKEIEDEEKAEAAAKKLKQNNAKSSRF